MNDTKDNTTERSQPPASEKGTHTPIPWTIAAHSDTDEVLNIVSDYSTDGQIKTANWIAELDASIDFGDDPEEVLARNEANAQFIVTAVNCHAELLAALKKFYCEACDSRVDAAVDKDCDFCASAHRAIAKAEGGK